jgi:phosphate transport system substrate-binding protein
MKQNIIATAILIFFLATNGTQAQGLIQIKGSDTSVNLVQRLSEVFMEKQPGTAIAVSGGGSGVGIAALINGQIQIADASRPMKDKELFAAKANGIIPTEIVIGIDALSIIIHSTNPVSSLNLKQIGAIFRGEIKNWNEIGGPDLKISLYGRQPNSGTYVFFQEHVLINRDYSSNMKQMNGSAQIVEGVRNDKSGIGYIGVGYIFDDKGRVIAGLKALDVAGDVKSDPVSPLSSANIKAGKYPISRALFQYISGKPKGTIQDFIQFMLSPDGQKVVEEMGFYPVSGAFLEINKKAGF